MSSPTDIRGVVYPSQAAAGRALGVTATTVHQAVQNGFLEFVGLGLKNRIGKPRHMNGRDFPSLAEAGRQLGVSPGTVARAIKAGRTEVYPSKRKAGVGA